jgi:glycosyltransferase involved in cell wall biosynthesis
LNICLIGATHPCHNPRLTREADALVHAGHSVRVVAPSITTALREVDRRHVARRNWRLENVDYCPSGLAGKFRAVTIRGRRRLSREIYRLTLSDRFVESGYTAALKRLSAVAAREPASWFIAHAQAALPVAAAAARRWNAKLGFDCEDLLSEVGSDSDNVIRYIEGRYLPLCDYSSVPSQGIAERIAKQYGVKSPLVLYNVFPSNLAQDMEPPASRPITQTLKLHWFGQTIGEGRGIEEALLAIKSLKGKVELNLRGWVSQRYRMMLESLAEKQCSSAKIVFHPPVDHDELIKTMGQFDVGLALERPQNVSCSLTVSNKVFSYLLAGLAIAATDTPGQREIMDQISSAGFLYEAGRPELLAERLQHWIDDRNALRLAQQAAWDAARARFCWDIEREKFFKALSLNRNGT